jgi:predicted phage tail protein
MKGGVRRYLLECTDSDVQFTVQKGEDFMDYDNIGHNLGKDDIIITPIPQGSKKGIGKIILGIILIVVSLSMGDTGTAARIAAAMMSIGVSLALQGIIEMTMDDPDELKEEKSSLFNGPINTTKMGVPVPICYGRMEVGGAVTNFGFTQSRIKNQMGYRFISKPSEGSTGTGSYGGTASGGGGGGNIDWVNNQVIA